MNVTYVTKSPSNAVASDALSLKPAGATGLSVAATGILGAATFGVLPALLWPGKFAELADLEEERLRSAARWASTLEVSKKTSDLLKSERFSVRPSSFLTVIGYALVFYIVVAMFLQFFHHPVPMDRLMDSTYGFGHHDGRLDWGPPKDDDASDQTYDPSAGRRYAFHSLWCTVLAVAYGAHFLQVRLHSKAVGRFVSAFNRIVVPRGIQPVQMLRPSVVRPLVIGGSIVFAVVGAWWGIPMLLAASAQSRYILLTRRSLALQLADRMRGNGAKRSFERRCSTQGCQVALPPVAKFCPQCGASVPEPAVDEVG